MRTIHLIFLFTLLLSILSCSKDYDLEKTIFFEDEEYPELPKYSEWGYNTFGAYFEREVFISDKNIIPAKVVAREDNTSLKISGRIGNYEEMTLKIIMLDFRPINYSELIQLNQTYIDLTRSSYRVTITIEEIEYETTILNGGIEFKRAQYLLVDKEPVEVILSGVFDFQLIYNDEPVTISHGRFDLGIGDDNFYMY